MRSRWIVTVCALPGVLVLASCGGPGGGTIPPSKGGDETRQGIEYPFGTPKNLKNVKAKKGKVAANAPAANAPAQKNVH